MIVFAKSSKSLSVSDDLFHWVTLCLCGLIKFHCFLYRTSCYTNGRSRADFYHLKNQNFKDHFPRYSLRGFNEVSKSTDSKWSQLPSVKILIWIWSTYHIFAGLNVPVFIFGVYFFKTHEILRNSWVQKDCHTDYFIFRAEKRFRAEHIYSITFSNLKSQHQKTGLINGFDRKQSLLQ